MNRATVLILIFALGLMLISPSYSAINENQNGNQEVWEQLAPMHQARSRLGVAEVNGKIYAVGGDDIHQVGGCGDPLGIGTILNANEEYNPTTNTWTFKMPMPTPRCGFAIAVFNNKVYCIGGYLSNGSVTGVNEAYNPVTDMWETKEAMPTPRMYLKAHMTGGKIYLIGGTYGAYSEASDANEVYDPILDSWTELSMSPHRITSAASTVVDNKIYFIATASSLDLGGFIEIYDTSKDNWSVGGHAPSYGGVSQVAISSDNRVLFFDEYSTGIYYPSNDSWATGTQMPTARGFAGVTVLAGNIHVIGGIKAPFEGHIVIASSLATHERYLPNEHLPLTASDSMIYIKADGSIEPPNANITTTDKVLYTFTSDIIGRRLVIERDNIVLNGNGCSLKDPGSYGIAIFNRNHVAVTNLTITKSGVAGIGIDSSTNILIIGNNVTSSDYNDGIRLIAANNNTITRNSIERNGFIGISFWAGSDNNTVYENDIKYQWINLLFSESKNNLIFHNNFAPYPYSSDDLPSRIVTYDQSNIWDNGYPNGGNWWEGHTDGEPYVIDQYNRDNYPLKTPRYIPNATLELSEWYVASEEIAPETVPDLSPAETIAFLLTASAILVSVGLTVYFKKQKNSVTL